MVQPYISGRGLHVRPEERELQRCSVRHGSQMCSGRGKSFWVNVLACALSLTQTLACSDSLSLSLGRPSPATPQNTTGTIVESAIDMPIPNPNVLQTGRTAVRHMGGARWLSVGLDRRGALSELDLGPTPRRTGGVSAGAQDTCVEIAHRIASGTHGLSPGPPAAPCRSAECKEHLAQTARRAARWQRVYRS